MIIRAVIAIFMAAALGAIVTALFGWGWWSVAVMIIAAVVVARTEVPEEE